MPLFPPRPPLPAVAFAALLSAVLALGSPRAAPPAALAGDGDFVGLVDIGGGRRMFLQCRGQGSPTVILVAGGLNTGGAWTVLPEEVAPPAVLPGLAAFTRVCAYDRPGTLLDADPPDDRSRSDPIPQPTTAEAMVADLHALLGAARVPGPYVLAGHSLGGLLSRLYASTSPDDVVGLVLVDAYSEAVRAAMTPEHWATWLATNPAPLPPELAASYPEYERLDLNATADTMERAAAAQPLRPMPLVVLSAGRTGEMTPEEAAAFPPGYADALLAANRAGHAFNAGLLPDARHVLVAESGHYIQAEQPALVIDAIRQVVTAVRDPASWHAPEASQPVGIDSLCGSDALAMITLQQTLPDDQAAALDDVLRKLVTMPEASLSALMPNPPSAGAGILVDTPHGRYFRTIGVADVHTCAPLRPQMPIAIGSNAKMMTAAIIYQLQEEGLLSTNDHASVYLPEEIARFPRSANATITQLLSHTAGLPDYLSSSTPNGLGTLGQSPSQVSWGGRLHRKN